MTLDRKMFPHPFARRTKDLTVNKGNFVRSHACLYTAWMHRQLMSFVGIFPFAGRSQLILSMHLVTSLNITNAKLKSAVLKKVRLRPWHSLRSERSTHLFIGTKQKAEKSGGSLSPHAKHVLADTQLSSLLASQRSLHSPS